MVLIYKSFEPFLIGALLFWQYNVVMMLQLELGQNNCVAVHCSIELNAHYFFLLSKHCFYIPVTSLFGASLVFKFFTQIDLSNCLLEEKPIPFCTNKKILFQMFIVVLPPFCWFMLSAGKLPLLRWKLFFKGIYILYLGCDEARQIYKML
jgi:hypothetical protein